MLSLEPEEVLGKPVVAATGGALGEIVDVGLAAHNRVKFLVIQDALRRRPAWTVPVAEIDRVAADLVTVRTR